MSAMVAKADAGVYRINPYISQAAFKLDHAIGFSSGFIKEFSGTVDIDEKKDSIKSLTLELDMGSVTTYNTKRDEMLQGADFFNSGTYPNVTLESKKINKDTIDFEVLAKGAKRKVTLKYRFFGFVNDVNIAKRKAIIGLTGSVSRTDLGVTHNVQDETGKNLLGDNLELFFEMGAIE